MKANLKEKVLLYKIIGKKDPEAYAELYDQYVNKIYRFVYLKVSNKEEAEDITSEIFLQAWHYLISQKEKQIKSFSGLIYKIARNRIVDLYRKRANLKEIPLEEANHQEGVLGAAAYKKMENSLETENILNGLKKMKQEYQEVLLLKYIEDLSISEIAEIVGKTRTSVRVTLFRAAKILKKLMGIGLTEEPTEVSVTPNKDKTIK